ncbi:MAG: DUF4838 domain-containing protein [Candidatus Hydrogenedentes bacterium]|nr:DUF4838 domain-containing protein [Candidatus Hydrogenedentota bacterium]
MRISLGVLCIVAALCCAGTAAALTLAKDGASEYTIVVADGALAPERTAAGELQEHLAAATGVTLPIVDEKDAPAGAKLIVVGPSARLKAAFPNLEMDALGHDGIVVKTAGDTLYLAGGRPRGTLYAVYTFLEDVVGCRWWTSAEQFIPSRPVLEIPVLDTVYAPALRYREAFYRDALNGVYAARSKCNGHHDGVPEEFGGHYSILGWCHTFYQLMPPEKYFAEHPEWYSEINGQRVSDGAQLCLTNDAMRAELTKNALEWIRSDPSAGMISITQNDCGGNCQCAKCAAIESEEGAPSGLLVRFVNSVAEDIGKQYPDVLVETLAYQYTRKAPVKARPRENVVIRLCTIECSFSEPLATAPRNADFRRDMEAWSAIAGKLYVWDYVTNFRQYLLPHANIQSLAPNIRFFVANNCIGLFEQGDTGSSCGEFVELRAWVLAHLMWDPSRDPNALIDEFLAGYYGPAAWPLRRYIDCMSDAASRADVHFGCFQDTTASWLGIEDLNAAEAFFDAAEAAVKGDSVLEARVRRARLPLTYAWLNRYHALKRSARLLKQPFSGPADPAAATEAFIGACESFDVGSFQEGAPFEGLASVLRSRFSAVAPSVPDVCKDLPEDRWLDIQETEFRLTGIGDWVELVDDPAASDGKAARMPATHSQWAVQFPISSDVATLAPRHCYLYVRCDANAAAGGAMQCGIYDAAAPGHVAQVTVPIETARDGYQLVDLGVHALTASMYVWVAPVNNPNEVDAVYVDRIVLVGEE